MSAPRMRLSSLLAGHAVVPPVCDVEVDGLTLDSRQVTAGDAFVALVGQTFHGLQHAKQARERGASCILFEPPLPAGYEDAAQRDDWLAVDGLRAALGQIADRYYAQPSSTMTVIGVTGTNGKTSTVQLLAQALHADGRSVGSIGTLGSGLYPDIEAGERTTPDVIAVHRLLAGLRDAGADCVAMEVSSHALDQGRVDAVRFSIAVFTNLTQDHLDYHGDMQSYGEAKARLFRWPQLNAAVINLDDDHGVALAQTLPPGPRCIRVSSRGHGDAQLYADKVRLHADGIRFDLRTAEQAHPVSSPLLGRFNVDNLLAVAGCLYALDWALADIAAMLSALQPVPGRMSRLGGGEQPLVVVDYAHTPDALEQSLQSLRAHVSRQLICVFGCGGERDRGKRPQMAAVAERLADLVIVTDDNPRNEDGDRIVAEILAGFARPQNVMVQRDRAAAISAALGDAVKGDVVLIAGKGHEPYQEIGGVRRAFDDRQMALQMLEKGA